MALIPTYKTTPTAKIRKPAASTPVNQNAGAPPAPRVKAVGVPAAKPVPVAPPQAPSPDGGVNAAKLGWQQSNTLGHTATNPAARPLVSAYSDTPAVTQTTPNIFDSGYIGEVAGLGATHDSTIAGINKDQGFDDAALTTALGRRAARLPEDLQNAKNAANKAGLFYSGAYGKQQGQINDTYANDVADINTGYNQRTGARNSGITNADVALWVGTGQAATNAGDRQVNRDIANPPPAPVPGVASAGGTGSVNIPAELHNLSQMAKGTKSPTALKNVAAMWRVMAKELKGQGQPVPAAPSALLKYL